MKLHKSRYGYDIECMMEKFGRCRICELTDVTHPDSTEAYRNQFSDRPLIRPEAESEPKSYPSPLHQLWSLGKSFIQHMATGFAAATEDEQEERLRVCMECDRYDEHQGRCRECGCFLGPKISWASERCPLEPPKWGPISRAEPEPEPSAHIPEVQEGCVPCRQSKGE